MSAKRTGKRYETPEEVLPFYLEMRLIDMVHTSIPAFVKEYDPVTKRARLQPAIRRQRFDTGQTFDRAQLLDVPVVSQATGGYMIYGPVKEGDLMCVVFSERGLQKFKEGGCSEVSDPVGGRYFDQMDGVAFKWGDQSVQPVDPDAICLQSASGNAAVIVKEDSIELRVGRGRARLTDSHFDTWRA